MLCNPVEEQEPSVDLRLIRDLCFCLSKPFSYKASPGKKSLHRQEGDDTLVSSQKRRAAVALIIKLVINRC